MIDTIRFDIKSRSRRPEAIRIRARGVGGKGHKASIIVTTGEAEPQTRRASIGARRNPASQAAILSAARAVLAEEGYGGFSIDAVSRRAGAGKPTVYRWWKTRADLLMDVYAAEKAALTVPITADLARDLTVYTEALWDFWDETPSGRTFRALVAEAQDSPEALDTLRDKFMPERTRLLRERFVKAVERGQIVAAEIEMRLVLYLGFSWYYVLTDRLAEGRAAIAPAMRLIAAPSLR